MLEIIDVGIENAVAFRISGKVSKMDMQVVLDEMKHKINRFGDIVIYQQVESFQGVAVGAFIEKLKYVIQAGFSDIVKVAILTDTGWMRKAAFIQNRFFRKIEIKSFKLAQQAEAITFLRQQ